jgi:DNA-binding PadR family transcriptional regulator
MPPRPTSSLPPHWFHILLSLADGERHGTGIMQDVLERTDGTMRLWPGMLYRNLHQLVDEGLLVEVDGPPEPRAGSPRFFAITAAGRRACAAEAARLATYVAAARAKKVLKHS